MATITFLDRKDSKNYESIGSVMSYAAKINKTSYDNTRLISGVNCMPEIAMQEFIATKEMWHKEGGKQFYHLLHSFENNSDVTPELAHQMAIELVEQAYPDYEAFVATHLDTDNIHSHIIINSVRATDGKKINQHTKEIYAIREMNDNLCRKYGLPVCKPKKDSKMKPTSPREYYAAMSGNSWKLQLMILINDAMCKAGSKDEFISLMNSNGYDVTWTSTRKNITYISKDNPKIRCRDTSLHDEKYLKENMEVEFDLRRKDYANGKQPQQDSKSNARGNSCYGSGQQAVGTADIGTQWNAEQYRRPVLRPIDKAESERHQEGSISNTGYDRQEVDGQGKRLDEKYQQGNLNTGWESERRAYYTIGESEQSERTAVKEATAEDADYSNSSNNDNINNLLWDISSAGELIETESDDYDLRERQRRARQNLNAVAYAMEELANLIEESKRNYDDNEDEEIGFEQSM